MTAEILKDKLNVCLQEMSLQGSCQIESVEALIHACSALPDEILETTPLICKAIDVFIHLEHSDNQILAQIVEWVLQDLVKVYEQAN